MKKLCLLLSLLGVVGILLWYQTREPRSLASELTQVNLIALQAPERDRGSVEPFIDNIRGISGVTAASFNRASGILGLTFLSSIPKSTIQKQLVTLTRIAFQEVHFAPAETPGCPVPQGFIRAIPGISLWAGILCLLSAGGLLIYLRAKN